MRPQAPIVAGDRLPLTWVAAVFGLAVGTMMTYVPYQFQASVFREIYPHIRLLGAGFLVSGVLLVLAALYPGWPRAIDRAGRLLFTGALGSYWWMVAVLQGGTTGAILYPVMILGLALEAAPDLRRRGLFPWFLEVIGLAFGVLLLFAPRALGLHLYAHLRPIAAPVGAAFFLGAAGLVVTERGRRRQARRAMFLCLAAAFAALCYALVRASSWSGVALYGVITPACLVSAWAPRIGPLTSLRWRLVRGVVVAGVLPLLALGGFASTVAQRAVDREVHEQARSAAAAEAKWLQQYLDSAGNTLRTLVDLPWFLQAAGAHDGQSIEPLLASVQMHHPAFDAIFVQSPTGQTWAAARPDDLKRGGPGRDFVEGALRQGGIYVSEPFEDVVGEPDVSLAMRVAQGAQVHGVLVGSLSLERLTRANTPTAERYRVRVIDAQSGRLVRDTGVGRVLEEARLPPQLAAAVDEISAAHGADGQVIEGPDTSRVLETFDGQGRRVLAAVERVPGWPWVVVASADLGETYAPISRISVAVVAFMALAALLGLLLSGWVARAVTAPLHDLRGAASALASGDLDRRVSAEGPDEIAELGRAFNNMADRIAWAQRDLSELKDALAQQLAEVQEASRLKDEFLSVVSHELRTPLNAILGWARMLRTGAAPEAARARALETIERNATLQAKLVEDLLDASRVISGKLRLELGEVDLGRVIQAAVDSVALAAQAKGIEIAVELGDGAQAVRGDAGRLQQVVWNLLNNAIKFTPKGGRVEVRLEEAEGLWRVAVADTGEGIPADFLPHVFERFRQADATVTRRHGGLGLGLAIVRHLVEAHGGTARVESAGKGKGTTFTVELPRLLDAPERVSRITPAGPRSGAAPSLAGLRVLVVDDEPDALEVARAALASAGAEIRLARGADDAMDVLSAWVPDVMVSDIGMPDVDGYTLIRRVRALPSQAGRTVPAIALTAYARTEDRVRVLSAGFQMHVPKPIDPRELAAAVASLARPVPPSRPSGRGRSAES